MDLILGIAASPSWMLLIGLGVLLGLEYRLPFREVVQSKLLHVATNLTIAGGNALVVSLLAGGLLLAWVTHANEAGWGVLPHLDLGTAGNIIASIVLLDLWLYWFHRANHRWPLLWRLHRAHHSDLDVDVTTALRFHTGEVVVAIAFKAAIIPTMGIPVLGWITYEILAQAVSQFQHSNIRVLELLDRQLRIVLVTPHVHWIHHSRNDMDHDRNYGIILSIWDRWFGTYYLGVKREDIQIGLDEYPLAAQSSLAKFFMIPFGADCRQGHP
jgi:sterol desaturase/sphingolipid hydroxylase (fatty acid hydroxylase superfamily)